MIVERVPGRPDVRVRFAAAVGCAFAGHVVAGAPLLYTAFLFTAYAAPDSVFMGPA
ncbi:hypothetical protein [Actinoplanes cyaneus]|uniref:hypothetical protein n=1 Tax=Actinoplanes cyaneus TaxID=52696 RepID=UPI001945A7B8|nr:hypothetical protein [Actinoplanes cyaneus]